MLAHSTLLLLGHGSTLNAQSSAATRLHAEAVRRTGRFGQVLEGYWKQEPSFSGVLRSAWHDEVFVVPFFVSEGYFTEQVIPRELGLPLSAGIGRPGTYRVGRQRVHYCGPVGTHPSMTRVLEGRAIETIRLHPGLGDVPQPSDVSLFVAGHGTSQSENSRRAVEDQVALIAARGAFHDVHAVFMEESPRIGEAISMARTDNVVMVPFFLSDGLHVQEDIPVLLGADPETVRTRLRDGEHGWANPTAMGGSRVWYARAIGDAPGMPDVIVERAMEGGKSVADLNKSR